MSKQYYADYDFEMAYQQQIEKLESDQAERYARANKGKVYQTKTTKAGKQLEVDIYPAYMHRRDMPRKKKSNGSRPAQKNLNDRKARRKLNNLIDANFGKGDLWCTFTYDDMHLPESIERAQELFRNFIRRVNRARKKEGKGNVRYICVTEHRNEDGEETRCHHHVIMDGDCDRDQLEILWKYGSRNHTRRISPDPDTNMAGISNYITKQAKDPKRRKGAKRWAASKNLTKPTITKSITKFTRRAVTGMALNDRYLRDNLQKAYPMYRFIDAEIRTNPIIGGFYIYARMVRD